jgi:hypothetical protein
MTRTSILILAAATILGTAAPLAGQTAYNPSTGKYYAIVPISLPLPGARLLAEKHGAHLACINSQAERDFLLTVFGSQIGTSGAWIGLSDEQVEGTFIWDDGSPVTYTSWAPGEPNNFGNDEDGVVMYSSGLWNDVPTRVHRRVLLESTLIAPITASILFLETFSPAPIPPNPWLLGPEWQIGPATPCPPNQYGYGDPNMDAEGVVGGGVAGVVLGGYASTTPHDYSWLRTPLLQNQGSSRYILTFDRWLNSDYAPYMINRITISDGLGSNSIVIWESGPVITDNRWTPIAYDVPSVPFPFRINFGFRTAAQVFPVSGWNLDSVKITAYQPPGPRISLYHPNGPGSAGLRHFAFKGAASAFTAFSLQTAPTGWFFGLQISIPDLFAQWSLGGPPCRNTLDAGGNAVFEVPSGLIPGIPIGAVSLALDNSGNIITTSNFAAFVL